MAYTFLYGNTISSTWRTYMYYQYSSTYSATKARFHVYWGVNAVAKHTHSTDYDTITYSATGVSSFTYNAWDGDVSMSKGQNKQYPPDMLFEFPRKASAYTATVTVAIKHSGTGAKWKGTSTAKINVTVPALPKYTVSYSANGGSGAPASQTKTHGTTLKLSATKPTRKNYTFKGWRDGDGISYQPSGSYTKNKAATMTAQWSYTPMPTATVKNIVVGTWKNGQNAVKGFSSLSCNVNAKANAGTITQIKLTVGSMTKTITPNTATYNSNITITSVTQTGTFTPTVAVTNSSGTVTYSLAKVTIVNPTWTYTFTINNPPPVIGSNLQPILTKLQVFNYKTGKYENATSGKAQKIDNNTWKYTHTFSVNYTSGYNAPVKNPSVKISLEYIHYDSNEKVYRKAFFSTSRNCNFSNGIYNTMFVSGADQEKYPNFTSRVWWCAINDPLYFPDTNYLEVGSNDTAVKGLAKVGSYLGAIKQSKTTDTAIYLIYPTSFDEMTTYAVKQGVQGVGALGKYTFNILGDETLFLSPNGVMAITPSEDEEHKVQNRSYFVDGRLLKEDTLTDAYSFVYDGKYWLAVVGEDAVCYVLDGNQRNSWGNDRTVLVYECYLLDNVPARCFVKYRDDLLFSTGDEVCRFKRKTDANPFTDAYRFNAEDETEYIPATLSRYDMVTITQEDYEEDPTLYYRVAGDEYVQCDIDDPYDPEAGYYIFNDGSDIFNGNKTNYFVKTPNEEEGEDDDYIQCTEESVYDVDETYYTAQEYRPEVPVKAEWSTLFDDDGALHYYKTMQKKGNVVSILPLENETGYTPAFISEEEFNANKTNYYLLINDKYVKCSKDSVFDETETYYVERHSATRVFVKKDNNDEIEVQRTFSRSSNIPSEMVLRKKFKKYKRLQIILRNEVAEDFGVDQIVKSYLLKSYAKK